MKVCYTQYISHYAHSEACRNERLVAAFSWFSAAGDARSDGSNGARLAEARGA